MHYRGIAWILWSMRVQGFGYYLDNIIWDASKMNFAGGWQPARARVSAHLLRDGTEERQGRWLAKEWDSRCYSFILFLFFVVL
jgi:hypothetical protein